MYARASIGERYDRPVPDRLYFTDSDEANALIASDPMALLVGFALDQQVPVQKAFAGPLVLRERLGGLDAATLASADLEPVFSARPAIHRFPASMARRVPGSQTRPQGRMVQVSGPFLEKELPVCRFFGASFDA